MTEKINKNHRKDRNKIRVLRVVSRMNVGGPSIHVNNLTKSLNNERFMTKLITGSISPGEGDMSYLLKLSKDAHVVIRDLQREISLYHDLKALLNIIKEIKRFKPHIIHSHTSKAGTISRIAAFICNSFCANKIVTVHTFHGNVLNEYFARFKSTLILWNERLLARRTDAIIAISKTQKYELSDVFKIAPSSKIYTIELGFDLKPFQTAYKRRGIIRKKFGISDDEILIGIVGRMAPIKNHKMFLDAGKYFAKRQKQQTVKFLIVGDGEEHQFLKDYTIQLGLLDKVIFTGWERDLPKIYADLDILALTSLNEGTPVSIIEAMAASVPVVTTGVGGIKDLLGKIQIVQPTHNAFNICEYGILCPKNDSVSFSDALIYMFKSGYLKDRQRFKVASDYVVKNYSIERLVGNIESLYEDLIASKITMRNRDCSQGKNILSKNGIIN